MYYNYYIFSFAQDSVAKKLRKDLHFTRDMGKIYTAMENQLQELNVKRQAYHSNSFVGNHVNTCLKVQCISFYNLGISINLLSLVFIHGFFALVIKSRLEISKRFATNW